MVRKSKADICKVYGKSKVRERSFLIIGTGTDDFWQGYETFSNFCGGTQILSAIFMGCKTISLEKIEENILNEVTDQRMNES